MSGGRLQFELTEGDKSSGLWLRLKQHFADRLAAARLRNDGILSEAETALLRGEIKCLKALTALDADRPWAAGTDDQPR